MKKIILLLFLFPIQLISNPILELQHTHQNGALSSKFLTSVKQIFKQINQNNNELSFVSRNTFVIIGNDHCTNTVIKTALEIFNEVYWLITEKDSKPSYNLDISDKLHIHKNIPYSMIPKILISLPTSPIIYLTGHTNKNFLSLEQKIRYLTESNLNDAIILVDQAQLFEKPIIKVNQSLHKPSLQLLVRKLQLTNPLYYQLKEIIPFLKGRGPEEFSSKSEECEILIGRYNSIINSLYRLIIGLLVDDIMNPILLNKNLEEAKDILHKFKQYHEQQQFYKELNILNFPVETIDNRITFLDHLLSFFKQNNITWWHNVAICLDIIIVYPARPFHQISETLQGITFSKLFNDDFTVKQIIEYEHKILKASNAEKEALIEFIQSKNNESNTECYKLYKALLLQKYKDFPDAEKGLKELLNTGFNHWRIYWYLGCILKEQNNESANKFFNIIPPGIYQFLTKMSHNLGENL